MSLDWDATKTAWSKQDKELKEKEWPYVEATIWRLMAVGIGRIDAKTLPDVVKRFAFYETMTAGQSAHIPEDLLGRLVGLRTNVGRETFGQFSRRMVLNWERDYDYEHRTKEAR